MDDQETAFTAEVAPEDIPARVRDIWIEVLDTSEPPVDVSFFEAGGDSLLFLGLLERVNRLVGREVDAAELFGYGTLAAQIEFVRGEMQVHAHEVPSAAAVPDRRRLLDRSGRAREGVTGA